MSERRKTTRSARRSRTHTSGSCSNRRRSVSIFQGHPLPAAITQHFNRLKDDVLINMNKKHQLQGITNEVTTTIGSTTLDITIENRNFEIEFYVVYSEFPIHGDGIIEEPFLTRNRVVIDVGKGELFFQTRLLW